MRKFLISLAVTGSALAVATPASAQYYPQPQGNAYGYHNNYGQVRALQARINHIQRQIAHLDRRNVLSNREARRLRDESRILEQRLRNAGRNGLSFRERQSIEVRIARLELRVRRDATDGNRWGQNSYNNGYNGYNNGYHGQNPYDRDRDGRDDRYEDDRGRDHDGRRDRDDDDDD